MDKLYITDLDKTFLKDDLSVGAFSKEVWNELAGKGVVLSVATARSLKKSLEFLQGLDLKAPLICLDGAMVATSDGKLVRSRTLPPDTTSEIVAIAQKEFDIEPFIVGYDTDVTNERFLYPKQLNPYQQQLVTSYKNDSRLRAKERLIPLKNNLKIVYMGKKEQMLALEGRFKEVFGSSIEIKNAQDVYFDCWFLTVLHPLGDKAHALEDLLEYLGKTKEELCVFGDSLNDIGMFQIASKAIAVANAHEEAKKHAHIVLERTNNEEAVAHYLHSKIRS